MKLSSIPVVDQLAMISWILVPLALFVAHRLYPHVFARWRWTRRGVVYGAIALPTSILLYSFFFLVPVIGIIPGLPGLILVMWHLMPFGGAFQEFYGAVLGGASPATGAFSLWKPTLFWGLTYGFAGAALDMYSRHRQTHGLSPKM